MTMKMKYVFDIDGTICNNTYGKYEEAKPYADRITRINSLFDRGNKIVFFTARGMGSTGDDRTLAIEKYYEFTFNQLVSWGVNFHELILGKPSADMYIDDKGIHDEQFFSN